MDEFTTASTETVASDVSGNSADTTAASGITDAGEATAVTQNPDISSVNDAEAPGSQIDAGWEFGGEEQAEQAFPEDDSDIDGLTSDPALDPERTPKLVENLRNLRKEFRELDKRYRAERSQYASLDQYGGLETVLAQAQFAQRLFNPSAEAGGIAGVLNDLYTNAQPVYAEIFNDLLKNDPQYALQHLQSIGAIPAQSEQAYSATAIDPDTLSALPENLQRVAKTMSPEDVAEFNELLTPEAQAGFLKRIDKLNQLDATQRQQIEQQRAVQVNAAYEAGQKAVKELGEQCTNAHLAQFRKWSPFGPENAADNEQLYASVMQGAFADLLADQKWAQMHADATAMIEKAPLRRLNNEVFAADNDERRARGMVAQLNTRLGQLIKERVTKLDSVFRDARAYREQQRSQAPNRTEFSGQSTQVQSNKVNSLDKNGRISDRYVSDLTQRIEQQLAGGGR